MYDTTLSDYGLSKWNDFLAEDEELSLEGRVEALEGKLESISKECVYLRQIISDLLDREGLCLEYSPEKWVIKEKTDVQNT